MLDLQLIHLYFKTLHIRNRGRSTPTLMQKNDGPFEWKQMACGGGHTVGVNQEGDLLSWGDGDYGQLGDGKHCDGCNDYERRTEPEPKIIDKALFSKKVQQVTCGSYHTCVIINDGEVYSW